MPALLLGLLAGAVHVLSGPDHLASVAPLSMRRGGWRTGFVWGVGHTSGVWVVGLAAFLTRQLLPISTISLFSDRLAGAGLVLLGLWTLSGLAREWSRSRSSAPHPGRVLQAASMFGVLHGLAGSSHYLGVLPAFAFASTASTVAYLFGFGVANMGTMTACAWLLGRSARFPRAVPVLRGLAGAAALVIGAIWVAVP